MNSSFSNALKTTSSRAFEEAINKVIGRKFIVGSVSEAGQFSISSTPAVHDSLALATSEASRLAKLNPGTSYVAMQLAKGVMVPKVTGQFEF